MLCGRGGTIRNSSRYSTIMFFGLQVPSMLKADQAIPGELDIRHIGFRIRAARRRKKLTQAQVAQRAGIHKGHLSRIERGEKLASLGTLHMLSVALEASLSSLIGESHPKNEIRVTRAEKHLPPTDMKAFERDAHYKTVLEGGPDSRLSMMIIQVATQATQETAIHGGEEVIFVLEGSVRVKFDKHELILSRHDSVSFPGYLSHSLCAQGEQMARVLVAIAGDKM